MIGQTRWLAAGVVAALAAGCTYGTKPKVPEGAADRSATVYELEGERFTVQTVVRKLDVPWALGWLPDGTMLVTERAGRLLLVDPSGELPRQVIRIEGVDASGEHGLMGLAISPDYTADHFIFVSYTARKGMTLVNRISRFVLQGDRLFDEKVLVDDLPAGDHHDGLPLAFGPDGMLYASTGDGAQKKLAQDMRSLAGKFLRMDKNGRGPADNPFAFSDGRRSLIWSLGHRDCQGFSWDPISGELYATEHGPAAPADSVIGGGDEVNRIRKGCNYGWPVYHHDANGPIGGEECVGPLKQWTPGIGPSGAVFYTGKKFPMWYGRFFLSALEGRGLWCVTFAEGKVDEVEDVSSGLEGAFGQVRAMAVGPDGLIYLTTSNRDRQGTPTAGDDRVLRLVPSREPGEKTKAEPKKHKTPRKPKPGKHTA